MVCYLEVFNILQAFNTHTRGITSPKTLLQAVKDLCLMKALVSVFATVDTRGRRHQEDASNWFAAK